MGFASLYPSYALQTAFQLNRINGQLFKSFFCMKMRYEHSKSKFAKFLYHRLHFRQINGLVCLLNDRHLALLFAANYPTSSKAARNQPIGAF